jgi:hypothetical protein
MKLAGFFTTRELQQASREVLIKARGERFLVQENKLVPFSENIELGVKEFTYRTLNVMGRASIIANGVLKSEDLSLFVDEFYIPMQTMFQGYTISVMDQINAEVAGMSGLNTTMMEVAAQTIYNGYEEIGWRGVPGTKTVGLTSNPNVNLVILAADGVGSPTTKISGKSPAQQLRDLNQIANNSQTISERVFVSDTMLVPQDVWDSITGTYLNLGINTQTVYAAFLENQRMQNGIKDIFVVPSLKNAAPGGLGMIVCYKKSSDVLYYVRGKNIKMLRPQLALEGSRNGYLANAGGIAVKQGVGVTYAYGA